MLGTDLTEWAAELAAELAVPVELDPRDLVLPGILVIPGVIDFDRLDAGTASSDVELWLIAGDSNPRTALDEVTALLLKLRAHLGDAPSVADPITVTISSQSPDPLPALRCPIPITLSFTQEPPNDDPED